MPCAAFGFFAVEFHIFDVLYYRCSHPTFYFSCNTNSLLPSFASHEQCLDFYFIVVVMVLKISVKVNVTGVPLETEIGKVVQ